MANPLRLAYQNYADQALIDVSAIGSLPGSNLKTDDIQQIWRGTSATGAAIRSDLGQLRQVGAIALINTSGISAADTHRVRISTTDPDGIVNNVYDSGEIATNVDPVFEKYVHFVEPNVMGRHIRISLTVATGPVEAGRLVIAPTWAPSRDMSFGWEKLSRDSSSVTESLGGNPFIDVRHRRRGWRFRIFPLTEGEAEAEVDELNRLRGTGRDILVCRDINSTNLGRDTLWGLLEAPVQQRRVEGGYEIELTVWD